MSGAPGESPRPDQALTVTSSDSAQLTAADLGAHESLRDRWLVWIEGEVEGGRHAEMTLEGYRTTIRFWYAFLENRARTAQPSPATVRDYVADIISSHEPATANTYLSAVKSFYRWCESNDLYPSIGRSIKPIHEHRDGPLPALTHDQVVDLIANIPETTLTSLRDRALISVMYATAMRTVSLVRADLEDLDLASHQLRHQGKGHQSKDTIAVIAPSVSALLGRYLDDRRREELRRRKKGQTSKGRTRKSTVRPRDDTGTPLFIALDRGSWGRRLTSKSIRRIVLTYMEKSGFVRRDNGRVVNPGVYSAHCLRRSAAVTTADAGGIELAQGLLGHASVETTKKAYARVKLDRGLRENAKRLDPLS